jgi:hypothetical protein
MDEKLKEHIDYILYEVQNKLRKANASGALTGEENEHALIRACTKLAVEEFVLTREASEIYKNLKHFV